MKTKIILHERNYAQNYVLVFLGKLVYKDPRAWTKSSVDKMKLFILICLLALCQATMPLRSRQPRQSDPRCKQYTLALLGASAKIAAFYGKSIF